MRNQKSFDMTEAVLPKDVGGARQFSGVQYKWNVSKSELNYSEIGTCIKIKNMYGVIFTELKESE